MPTDVEAINKERLSGWEKKLNEARATAMIVIGVGHDENAGQIHFIVPEGVSMDSLRNFAYAALSKFIFNNKNN